MQNKKSVYISLGSNIDAPHHIAQAREKLLGLLTASEISPVYQSPAVGMQGNDFLNAVVAGTTSDPVYSLIEILRELENSSGRVRTENKFTDRTLDLDLLLYGDLVCKPSELDTSPLTLPSPEILEQAYVLKPFADIAGDVVHPVLGQKISEIYECKKRETPGMFLTLKQITLHTP